MIRTTALKEGFYPLQDTSTRGSVIAFYDGASFHLPGSTQVFPESSVHRDGYENGGRFNLASEEPIALETGWSIENGQFI